MQYLFAVFTVLLMSMATASGAAPSSSFDSQISVLECKVGGRVGVAVVSANGSPLFGYRASERFAICSTFKVLLSAFVLSRVDARRESLRRPIRYTSSDILTYAPITKQHLVAGHMTVSELNAAAIEYSDNTAADLLLNAVGGPGALTSYLRSIGDNVTRLDRNEPSLNTNIAGDQRDTSTPDAMAKTLRKILVGNTLSPASRAHLKAWMIDNTTGNSKLRAGFSKTWIVGDKTGSGDNGASNDVAIVYPRGHQPFIISVFCTGAAGPTEKKSAVIAEVARITSRFLSKHH